jgi:hypothetical protein
MDDLINIELELELKALRKEIDQLKKENQNLRDVIVANDLNDEIGIEKVISPEEEICLLGIEQILEAVKHKIHTKIDIQNYDILHRHLRMIRGQKDTDKKSSKKVTAQELLKIVEGDKK